MSNEKFIEILKNIEVQRVEATGMIIPLSIYRMFDDIIRLRLTVCSKRGKLKTAVYYCDIYRNDGKEDIRFKFQNGHNFFLGKSLNEKQTKILFNRVIEHKDIRLLWLLGEI